MNKDIITGEDGTDAVLKGAALPAQPEEELSPDSTDNGSGTTSGKTDEEKERENRRMKQEAFGVGLWQGFIVGAIATAAVFLTGKSRRK